MTKRIVIVGSGLAGYNLAREIRKHDKSIEIIMITRDNGAFYSKPQLSNAFIYNKTPDMLMAMTAEKMQAMYNMTILTKKEVTDIDREKQEVVCGEERFPYTFLVLALGADTPPPPGIAGNGVEDVFQVNDVYQYAAFRQAIADKKKVALIGAGLIGCEFANDLTHAGYSVDIIDLAKTPIPLLLPEKIGLTLKDVFASHGVTWHLNTSVKMIERIGASTSGYRLTLANGNVIEVDVVMSAIGLKPRLALAEKAGLETNRGIIVDHSLRTSDPFIYALGDCSEIDGRVLPYVAPLVHGAKALATTLLGEKTNVHFPPMPIVIKTSWFPINLCYPHGIKQPEWEVDTHADSLVACCYDEVRHLQGFILTGDETKHRLAWLEKL